MKSTQDILDSLLQTREDISTVTVAFQSPGKKAMPRTIGPVAYYLYDTTNGTYIPAVAVVIGSKAVILPRMPFFSNAGTVLAYFKNWKSKAGKSSKTSPTKKK